MTAPSACVMPIADICQAWFCAPMERFEKLESNGTLLGLFQQWDCSLGECTLFAGDLLALYTDGITEACNDAGEEFGEQSLVERLHQHRDLPCHTALTTIADEVRRFNSREQHDDITLILAKCKARVTA